MSALLFILVLFVLVLVHEWGHFIVARKTGMRVDEFGIGFPPRLWGKKRGETLYSLNAVPLGGFVKIYGEDLEAQVDAADSSRAFTSKSLWAQAAVLVAGVTMNILFAWLLFTIAFTGGTKESVDEASASASAELTVMSVLDGSPAAEAGLRPGDHVVKVVNTDGHPVERLVPTEVSGFIQDQDMVSLTVLRGGEEVTKEVSTARNLAPDAPEKRVIGITMGLIEEVERPFYVAAYEAGKYTIQSIGAIVVGISSLIYNAFLFQADFSGVAGPVGIAGLVGDAAAFGFTSLLMFTAFISLNLAVINLLPFPALDGGRLLFVIIDAIKGSPVPVRFAQTANMVGFALLMLLMAVVTFHDIARIF